MKLDFSLINWRFYLSIYTVGNIRTQGIHNRIKYSPYRVLFMDYDYYKQEWVEEEINFFIKKYKLGDFILLKTSSKGFHAICFDVITTELESEILSLSGCDPFFKSSSQWDFRSKVLRITEKGNTQSPEFMRIIRSPYNNKRKKSAGHYLFYKKLFKLKTLFFNKSQLFKCHYNIAINEKENIVYEVSCIDYPTRNNI